MELYTGHCEYCNKAIKYQNNWIRHCKTKKHLKNKEKYLKSPEKSSFSPVLVQFSPVKVQKEYKCIDCEKTYTNKSSYYYHRNKACKVKKENEEKDKLIEELKKQLQNKNSSTVNNNNNTVNNNDNKSINNTVNNNDNKTINQTINLNVYGQEAIIFDSDFLWQLQNESLTDVDRCKMIMEKVFIETEENRNLQLTNMRSMWGKIFDGTEWKTIKSKEQINNRISKLPITYNRGARECINSWEEADDSYKQEQLAIHKNLSKHMRENTLNNKGDVKDIYDSHREDLYNYH